jgi:DNA-binding NarL/FixJ family response regulator
MTDPVRADVLEALHRELLEQETRLRSLIGRLLDRERRVEPAESTARKARTGRPGDQIRLTKRDVEILRLVVRGHSNPQIGAQLGVAPETIRNHLGRIFRKLGVTTRTHAAVRALELGLIAAGPSESS